MKKRELNPEVQIGDRIMLLHMTDENLSMPMGLEGTVVRFSNDPYEPDGKLIVVNWDNGSNLPLIPSTDTWIKIQKKINEQQYPFYDFFLENPDLFEFFDYKFFKNYLEVVRKSGIVNMLGSSHLLYTGKHWIETHFPDEEDNQYFDELLDLADESKDKMIQGILKYLDSKDEEYDLDKINRFLKKFANKILQFFIVIH